mmetsp:Transcript_27806/g.51852  ORF Transcript_27806/g.51852 Transcript_27806/m.51852 type:complete len:284 (+) Transcript_27806:2774-3625(+)
MGEIHHDETFHPQAFDHNDARQVARACRACALVLADGAATNDAAPFVHQVQRGLQNLATDIVEIDVDPIGAGGAQGLEQPLGPVIDASVKAQFIGDKRAFVRTTRDAHNAAAQSFADLAHIAADGPCRGGDHNHFARKRFANTQQTMKGRLACNAVNAVQMGQRLDGRHVLDRAGRAGHVVGPDAFGRHNVAGAEAGRTALDHFADAVGGHDIACMDGGAVRCAIQPTAIGRVDAHQDRAQQHLTVLRDGHGRVLKPEVIGCQCALGQRGHDNLSVGHWKAPW